MMIFISPAKTLEMCGETLGFKATEPRYLDKSQEIMEVLREYQPSEIEKLMKISTKLSELNYIRNGAWKREKHNEENPCIFAFKGDVYKGININEFDEEDIKYANKHLRILSGLYGLLRPLDGIHEYRLEMGTKINVNGKKNLYEFWGENFLREEIIRDAKESGDNTLINLASEEYSKVLSLEKIEGVNVITPVFKEFKGGQFKIVGIYAKKARGLMTSYILKNRINDLEELKAFSEEGYEFNTTLSTEKEYVFTRI